MGMDIYGVNAKQKNGEYFRNNIWYWHNLWDYAYQIDQETDMPVISEKIFNEGHTNNGAGLNEKDSRILANRLRVSIEDGTALKLEIAYRLPRSKNLYPGYIKLKEREDITKYLQSNLLRPESYHFDVVNLKEFICFLDNCGGFEIN